MNIVSKFLAPPPSAESDSFSRLRVVIGTSLGHVFHLPVRHLCDFATTPPLPLAVTGDTVTCAIYSHFAGERAVIVSCASGYVVCLNAMEMDEVGGRWLVG